MRQQRAKTGLEIAVIGMAGRFPGARDVDRLWALLRDGIEPITEFSEADIAAAGNSELAARPDFVSRGFVLDDIDLFDAAFFGYTPREAEIIDPQQRFFLECASEALERAGYDPDAYRDAIGVFAGASMSTYLLHNILSDPEIVRRLGPTQLALANDKDYIATRVAYKLNLEGPAATVQTACSTSLVAVHLACQSLLAGECDMALAGGVSIPSRQRAGYLFQDGGIASRDGHCRPFDAAASGTSGGNGCGVVVLKRLADAMEDGDQIDAVILGSAINNDGSRKIGFTAPRVEGQVKVIQNAQRIAEVTPADIDYIEAHGTGTPLGDPIEIAALTRVFRDRGGEGPSCAIGSIKSNFGHADAAAGVAGLMKTVLALKHRMLPPSLNFVQPNPKIDFANSPFYVNNILREWRQPGGAPRRAGVSSFGLGGTNAHVVLEEAPAQAANEARPGPRLMVLSARTATALETATQRLTEYLRENPTLPPDDVAYTLQVGRRMFEHRRAVVCDDLVDAAGALAARDPARVFDGVGEPVDRGVVFMFSGQGAQYPRMTQGLYRDHEVFRDEVNHCCERLRPHLNLDLRSLLYPDDLDATSAAEALKQTAIAQAALFVVEYALARLWMSWGVKPVAMIGHSIGEYVAACVAGVFSLDEALVLVAERGRLMQAQITGAMLSAALSREQLEPLLGAGLDVAAVNSPASCVVSGSIDGIAALEQDLAAAGHACRRLHTSHAFHSAMMEPMLAEFARALAKLRPRSPQIPYISNLTGAWITAEQATDPAYWSRHLRHTVQFSAGVETLLRDTSTILLELGPGNTLCSLVRQHPACPKDRPVLSCVRHPHQQESDSVLLLNTLGRLWLAGKRIAWPMLHAGEARRRICLPTYPFERQRYWLEPQAVSAEQTARSATPHKHMDVGRWFYVPIWKPSPLPDPVAPPAEALRGRWLLFQDDAGLGARLAAGITQQGGEVTRVIAGAFFEQRGPDEYVIDGNKPEDYRRLWEAVNAKGVAPDRIVHAWAVDGGAATSGDVDLERGFYSVLYLMQALGWPGPAPRLRIDLLANHVHAVTGEEVLRPEKAAVLGVCRTLAQELPSVSWTQLDIESWDAHAPEAERLAGLLLAHLALREPNAVVAWRGRRRWVLHFDRLPDPGNARPLRLRQGGVYLITGGLGGVGMILAEYLAKHAQARLVLTGRSAFPDPADWEAWLAGHDKADPTSRKIRKLQALQALGAEVTVRRVDVANREQMVRLASELRDHFGDVHGIVHAAGIVAGPSFALLPDLARTLCEQQFQAKVQGLRLLTELFIDAPLDFALTTSSVATVLGGVGMAAYAAANLVMDALCHQQHRIGNDRWLSVDWEAWALQQDMAQTVAEGSTAALALSPAEGAAAFERVLRLDRYPQVIVSTADLATRLNQWAAPAGVAATAPATPRHARTRRADTSTPPTTETQRVIAIIWQELFGIDQLGVHDNFFDLGGHSLMALQIASRIRERLEVELSLAKFLELGTIEKVAAHIDALSWAATIEEPINDADAQDRDEILL